MARTCCSQPVARIIKVGDFEAGLVGLDKALQNVYNSGVDGEEEIKNDLVEWIKNFGNYVPPSREDDYKKALWREYRQYMANVEREVSGQRKR